jgi:cbb3-type cytochrome oxidase subunit 3
MEPFEKRPVDKQKVRMEWWSAGTGSPEWSIAKIIEIPTGLGIMGDLVMKGYFPGGIAEGYTNSNHAYGVECLYVKTNRPDVAKPCTGYELVYTTHNQVVAQIYIPTHTDPNYIGIGHVIRHTGRAELKPGDFYCIHRNYLTQLEAPAVRFHTWSNMHMYRTIDGYNMFRFFTGYNNTSAMASYSIITDKEFQQCCMGQGLKSKCGSKEPGSGECQIAMKSMCGIADIKPGGKCIDWCAQDVKSCDIAKNQFCAEHPTDPFCDCINATSRADYKDLIKGREKIYNTSIPVCYYDGCQTGPNRVFTTSEMAAAQNTGKCSTDSISIAKKIRDAEEEDILSDPPGGSNEDPGGQGGPPSSTIMGMNATYFWILLVFIAVIFGVVVYFKSKKGNNANAGMPTYDQYQSGMQYGMPASMPASMPTYDQYQTGMPASMPTYDQYQSGMPAYNSYAYGAPM